MTAVSLVTVPGTGCGAAVFASGTFASCAGSFAAGCCEFWTLQPTVATAMFMNNRMDDILVIFEERRLLGNETTLEYNMTYPGLNMDYAPRLDS